MKIGVNDVIFSKVPHGLKLYIITISVENCTNKGPKFLFFFVLIAVPIVITISIRAIFLRI